MARTATTRTRNDNMRALTLTAYILVIAGALNWLLIGLVEFNLVNALFGAVEWLERLVYILVGLAGIYMIYHLVTAEGRTTRRSAPLGPV